MTKKLAFGTVVLVLAAVPAFAQATGSGQKSTRGQRNADETFVTKAASGGMAEVQLGQLAQQKASSPDVKSFGQRMVDDHSKANDELKSIAGRKGITIPMGLQAKDKATYNRLSKLSGPAFDRAYMQDMLKDHQTDVADFQYESRSGVDDEVRNFATKTLPTLQDHLKMAETTNGAVGTSGMKNGRPIGTSGQR